MPIHEVSLELMAADQVAHGEYVRYLIDAIHVRAFMQHEILVDILNYAVYFDTHAHAYRVTAPAPALEQAIRLGYIHTEFQWAVQAKIEDLEQSLSLREAAETF